MAPVRHLIAYRRMDKDPERPLQTHCGARAVSQPERNWTHVLAATTCDMCRRMREVELAAMDLHESGVSDG